MAKKRATSRKSSKETPRGTTAKTHRVARKSTVKTGTRTAGKSTETRAKRVTRKAAAGARKTRTVEAKPAATTKKSATKRTTSPSKTSRPSKAGPVNSLPERRRTRRTAAGALAETPVTPAQPIKTVSPFAAKDLEEFRAMLLEKRAQLMGDLGTLQKEALAGSRREASGDLSSMPVHMADLGTDNYELEFTLGLVEGERAVLGEIDEALERMRNGTYGVCLGTGKPIGKARLRAKPWAKYCYEYTLAMEKGQPRRS